MRIISGAIAACVLIGGTAAANAAVVTGQISMAGYVAPIGSTDIGSATGLDFVSGATGTASPGVAGGITSFGAGTGSFAGLACASVSGGCGSIKDILSFTAFTPLTSFMSYNTGTSTAISFDLNSLNSITRGSDSTGGSLTLNGSGVIHFTGYDNTAATFSLTAQGNQVTSFSATTVAAGAVPEPASWAMMLGGFGMLGGAMRRRRASVSFA